jgi:hypothetical protein
VEETGLPGENHWPVTSHWQILSHNVVESGSKSELCDPVSGQCSCKDFVTNKRCDKCMTGTSHLDENNPYGCSKGKSPW